MLKLIKNKKKITKFLLLWISSYWLNLFITFFCNKILEINIDLSYFITIFFLTIYQFWLSLKVVFKTKFSFKILIKYLVILFSFSMFNYFLVIFLKNYFWEEYFYIIIVLVITIMSIMKFIIYNNFVFKELKRPVSLKSSS